ncbi:MAG: sialate O-acetylesterase [Aquabacterium sp.]|nr:sialate O-acetylesterase [Aquabacterium sp.]
MDMHQHLFHRLQPVLTPLLLALSSAVVQAAPALTNANFEAPALADNDIRWAPPNGWTGGSGTYNPSARFYASLQGKNTIGTMAGPRVAFLWDQRPAPLQQTTTLKVEAGRTYTLTVALGGRSTDDPYAGAGLDLLVNGAVVATRTVDAPPAPGTFADVSLAWTGTEATAGGLITVQVRAVNPRFTSYVDVDHVRLVAGLVNGSFEAQPQNEGAVVQAPPVGWQGGSGFYHPSAAFYRNLAQQGAAPTMAGPHVAYLWGLAPQPLEQRTPEPVVAGTTYTLRAGLGGRTNTDVFAGLQMELLADGVVVARRAVAAPPLAGGFADVVLSWLAPASATGQLLGVRFSAIKPAANGYVDIDNVRLDAESATQWQVGLDNASFEAPALARGALRIQPPPGWQGGTGSYHPDASWYAALAGNTRLGSLDGRQVAYLGGNAPPALQQTTTAKVVAGATYTLTVASGGRTRPHTPAGLGLELTADGQTVATAQAPTAPAPGSFADVALRWTAPNNLEGRTLGVRVRALQPGPQSYVDVDHVRLSASAAAFEVRSPQARQVIQRTGTTTDVAVRGTAPGADQVQARLVARAGYAGASTAWAPLAVDNTGRYAGVVPAVAGGWYDLEVRSQRGAVNLPVSAVERVGVGEVFIIAGQSNSANWGSAAQTPGDDRVSALAAAYSGWQWARDPQPHANGGRGSPWPAFGTRFAADTGLPVAVVAVGVGGTVVAQWQPTASLYPRLKSAIQALGQRGFRAVLWHQGETDAYRCTSTDAYVALLNTLIKASRDEAGWPVPWGVATASQLPSATAVCKQAIDAAQAQVVANTPGVFAGPNTNGYFAAGLTWDRVHFNAEGLTTHGQAWVQALGQWGGVPAR